MRKTMISLLLCAAMVLSLAACGEKAADPLPRTVSAEEQLAESGIALYTPVTAENAQYQMVKSPTDGKAIPEVTFVWQGNTYHYRAEKTNKTAPYDFTGLNVKWGDEGSFENDDRVGTAYTGDAAAYLCWIEDGVAYLVYSDTTGDMFDIFDVGHEIATMDSWGGQVEVPDYVDDGEYTVRESTPMENMIGTWQVDGVGVFIRIDNFTYQLHHPNGEPVDTQVRFWEPDPENDHGIRLLTESGSLYSAFIIDDAEYGQETAVNEFDEPMHRWDGAMDGTYDCYLSTSMLEGNRLYLTAADQFYLNNQTVSSLQVGDTLELSVNGFHTIYVDSLEKISDTEYLVNDQTTLRYDEAAKAWLVIDDSIIAYTFVGNALLGDSVPFDDVLDGGRHDNLASCLEEHSSVYALVTVEFGDVTAIQVYAEF